MRAMDGHPQTCGCTICSVKPRLSIENPGLIRARVDELIALHGSIRKAADACGLRHGYMATLKTRPLYDMSPRVLRQLGIRKTVKVTFSRIDEGEFNKETGRG